MPASSKESPLLRSCRSYSKGMWWGLNGHACAYPWLLEAAVSPLSSFALWSSWFGAALNWTCGDTAYWQQVVIKFLSSTASGLERHPMVLVIVGPADTLISQRLQFPFSWSGMYGLLSLPVMLVGLGGSCAWKNWWVQVLLSPCSRVLCPPST